MAPCLRGKGWGMGGLRTQPKQCAGLSAHCLSLIPPQVPLTKDGGAAGGMAVGNPGARAATPDATQRPQTT